MAERPSFSRMLPDNIAPSCTRVRLLESCSGWFFLAQCPTSAFVISSYRLNSDTVKMDEAEDPRLGGGTMDFLE